MKKTIIFLTALFIGSAAIAQKIDVSETHGEVFKPKGYRYLEIYKKPSDGYLAASILPTRRVALIVTLKPKYFIQQFYEAMNLVSETEFSLKMDGKRMSYYDFVQFGGEYYLLTTFADPQKNKMGLYYSSVDAATGEVRGSPILLSEVEYVGQRGYTFPSFKVSISENKEYMVVFGNDSKRRSRSTIFNKRQTDEEEIGTYDFNFTFWLFDPSMKEVSHEKDYVLKVENSTDKFYVNDYEVDDNGAIYILGKNAYADQLSRRERKKSNRTEWVDIKKSAFILEKISPDGSSEQQVTPEETLFVDMDILFDKNGNVNLIGLEGEQVYSRLVTTGVSRLILDGDDLDILSETTEDFSEDVLEAVNNVRVAEQNMNKRRKKRSQKREAKLTDEEKAYAEISKRAALNVSTIAYSSLDEEGNAYVVLEEYYVRVVTTTTTNANGSTTTTTTYYYNYDDLILMKFFEDEVAQNYYQKNFLKVNAPLTTSINVVEEDGEVTVVTQGHVVQADEDLEQVIDYELQAFDQRVKVPGMRRKYFDYRKVMDDNTVLAPAQFKGKVAWYIFDVK
jgi:hypothetical protein